MHGENPGLASVTEVADSEDYTPTNRVRGYIMGQPVTLTPTEAEAVLTAISAYFEAGNHTGDTVRALDSVVRKVGDSKKAPPGRLDGFTPYITVVTKNTATAQVNHPVGALEADIRQVAMNALTRELTERLGRQADVGKFLIVDTKPRGRSASSQGTTVKFKING